MNKLSNEEIYQQVCELIAPFNKKNLPLRRDTNFSDHLEFDSLTVMDLLAAIEDHFDIIVPLNMLPDLETIGQVADAIEKIKKGKKGK